MTIISTDKALRPRDPHDHYPTNIEVARAALREVAGFMEHPTILDAGAGDGVWGQAARDIFLFSIIHGVELREIEQPNNAYNLWVAGQNYATYQPAPDRKYDLAIGNPAFGDLHSTRETQRKRDCKKCCETFVPTPRPHDLQFFDAEAWVRKAISEVRDGGYVVFLLRQAFLASLTRAKGLHRQFCPERVLTIVPRPSFTGDGNTDDEEYSIFIWHVGHYPKNYEGGWLFWREKDQDKNESLQP